MNTSLEIKYILTLYLNKDLAEYILSIIQNDIHIESVQYWNSITPKFIPIPFYSKDIYLLEHIRRINGNIIFLQEELKIINTLRKNNKILDEAWKQAVYAKDKSELLHIYQHIINRHGKDKNLI